MTSLARHFETTFISTSWIGINSVLLIMHSALLFTQAKEYKTNSE